jgi:hypothetical protein
MTGRLFESKQNTEKSANPHDHSSFDSKRFFSDQIERAAAATEEPLRPGQVKIPTRAHKPANDAAPINDFEPACAQAVEPMVARKSPDVGRIVIE